MPQGIVGWWALEGNGDSRVGEHTGTIIGSPTFVEGQVELALRFDQVDDAVRVNATPALDVGAGDGLTIELWVKPADLSRQNPLLEWTDNTSTVGLHLWTSVVGPKGGGSGSLFANLVNTDGEAHHVTTGPGLLQTGVYQHVALTYERASGLARLFHNGVAVREESVGSFTAETRSDLYFGSRPLGSSAGNRFAGEMDEIAIYKRALTSNEVAAIFDAGVSGKCREESPPRIIRQPQDLSVFEADTASFGVFAGGTPPMEYQWLFDGVRLTDETNATLVLANVQTNQAGIYAVIVSNGAGSDTSSNAVLVVSPLPLCESAPTGLVAWWPLDGDGEQAMGSETLVLLGSPEFVLATTGQGLEFDGVDDAGKVFASPALDVGAGPGLTVELWIKPDALSRQGPLLEWSDEISTVGAHMWISVSSPFSGGGPGSLFANLIDTQARSHHLSSPPGILRTGVFQHVALTYDQNSGVAMLCLNGTVVAQTNVGSFVPETRPDIYIGGCRFGTGSQFRGVMDEISLYNRALGSEEVNGIYQAGRSGKCQSVYALAPRILTQPKDLTLTEGQTASFSVSVGGSRPLTYQWRWNGNPVEGATNATLMLADVQTSQAGTYAVSVANAVGSTNSTDAVLVVNPKPPCAPPPLGLAAWWPLDGDGVNRIAADVLVPSGAPQSVPAVVGHGLDFNGITDGAWVSASPGLNIGAGPGLTVEMWISPSDLGRQSALAEWSDNSKTVGAHFWLSVWSPFSGGGPGSLFANLIDVEGRSHHVSSPAHILQEEVFQHVALTYDRGSGFAALYLNGGTVALTNVGAFVPETRPDLYVGRRLWSPTTDRFHGTMDEICLYGRALTVEEITAIYQAGVAGKCWSASPVAPVILFQPQSLAVWSGQTATFQVVASGTPPLEYQWRFNGDDLPSQTNASLTLTSVQLTQAGNYSVRVANIAAATVSDDAVLTVQQDTSPPVIVRQPLSHNVNPGGNTTFSVIVTGALPMTFTWRLNEVEILGAATSTLTILNAQETDAGTYSVVVSNEFGFAVSDEALLTVTNTLVAGLVDFANSTGSLIYDVDSVTRVSGSNYVVELLGGPNAGEMKLAEPATHFTAPGFFIGGTRAIPGVAAGQVAYVQVRVWDAASGTSYDEVLANHGKVGASSTFPVQTGGGGMPPIPPARLAGLTSFSLTQGAAPAPVVAYISPGRRLADGSLEWVVHGESGALYVIERSSNSVDWVSFTMVTPVNGAARFSDRAWSSMTYYRARLVE